MESSRRNRLHRTFLRTQKILPVALAACYFANTTAGCFGTSVPWLSYVAGLSLLPFAFIVFSSVIYGFCAYHRVPLYYCMAEDALNLADRNASLPLDDLQFLLVHAAMTVAAATITIVLYERHLEEPAGACV